MNIHTQWFYFSFPPSFRYFACTIYREIVCYLYSYTHVVLYWFKNALSKTKFIKSAPITYVNEFGSNIFSTDSWILFCIICEIKVNPDKKFNVSQHVKRDKHIKGLTRYEYQINRKQQRFNSDNYIKKSSFNKNLY